MSSIYIPFQLTPIFTLEHIYTQFLFTSNSSCSLIYIQYAFTSDFLCFYLHPLHTYISLVPACISTNHLLQYAIWYCFFSFGLARREIILGIRACCQPCRHLCFPLSRRWRKRKVPRRSPQPSIVSSKIFEISIRSWSIQRNWRFPRSMRDVEKRMSWLYPLRATKGHQKTPLSTSMQSLLHWTQR